MTITRRFPHILTWVGVACDVEWPSCKEGCCSCNGMSVGCWLIIYMGWPLESEYTACNTWALLAGRPMGVAGWDLRPGVN